MAMIATLKVMPTSIEINLNALKDEIVDIVKGLYPETDVKVDEQPIAFGLKALIVRFAMPETASVDEIEAKVKALEDIESAEIIDLRRAIG